MKVGMGIPGSVQSQSQNSPMFDFPQTIPCALLYCRMHKLNAELSVIQNPIPCSLYIYIHPNPSTKPDAVMKPAHTALSN